MKDISQNYHKKFCLLCSECNCLTNQSVSVFIDNVELTPDFSLELTNEYYCNNCGQYTLQYDIDVNISKSVRLLNIHGFKTSYSCQGHYKKDKDENEYISTPYIRFIDSKFLNYISKEHAKENMLKGKGWKIDAEYIISKNSSHIVPNNITLLDDIIVDLRYTASDNPSEEEFKEACENLYDVLLEILIDHDYQN